MSNSVVFLLIAVGLSVLGTLAVWLQGKPRRSRSSVDVFNRSLQALATSDTHLEPLSGVTVRPLRNSGEDNYLDDANGVDRYADDFYVDEPPVSPVDSDRDADAPSRHRVSSPRPNPRPVASRRVRTSREGADPGA